MEGAPRAAGAPGGSKGAVWSHDRLMMQVDEVVVVVVIVVLVTKKSFPCLKQAMSAKLYELLAELY